MNECVLVEDETAVLDRGAADSFEMENDKRGWVTGWVSVVVDDRRKGIT